MVNLRDKVPGEVYAEYARAAAQLNIRFGEANPKIEPVALMNLVLARYYADDICAQFDLALRLVSQSSRPLPNPVLPQTYADPGKADKPQN